MDKKASEGCNKYRTIHFTKQYPEQRAKDWLENYKQSNDDWNILMNKARVDERIQILKFLKEVVLADESKKNQAWCYGVKAAIMLIKGSNKKLRREATYEGWVNRTGE